MFTNVRNLLSISFWSYKKWNNRLVGCLWHIQSILLPNLTENMPFLLCLCIFNQQLASIQTIKLFLFWIHGDTSYFQDWDYREMLNLQLLPLIFWHPLMIDENWKILNLRKVGTVILLDFKFINFHNQFQVLSL